MESHKRQAITSRITFKLTFKRQEYMGSYPSRAKASFQLLLHNILQTCAGNASHKFKNELPI